jgi:hypothetical protein
MSDPSRNVRIPADPGIYDKTLDAFVAKANELTFGITEASSAHANMLSLRSVLGMPLMSAGWTETDESTFQRGMQIALAAQGMAYQALSRARPVAEVEGGADQALPAVSAAEPVIYLDGADVVMRQQSGADERIGVGAAPVVAAGLTLGQWGVVICAVTAAGLFALYMWTQHQQRAMDAQFQQDLVKFQQDCVKTGRSPEECGQGMANVLAAAKDLAKTQGEKPTTLDELKGLLYSVAVVGVVGLGAYAAVLYVPPMLAKRARA